MILGTPSVEQYTSPALKYALVHTTRGVEAQELTLQDLAEQIANEFKIPTTTLANLVYSESRWNPNADNGDDRGLVQINRKYNPDITDAQAFDPEFALRFAAKKISEGKEWLWTPCSCTSTVRLKIKDFPRGNAVDLKVNTIAPRAGDVVKMRFGSVYHVAYIEEIRGTEIDIWQGNKTPCLITTETISVDDPRILGYWSANPRQELKPVVLYSKTIYMSND